LTRRVEVAPPLKASAVQHPRLKANGYALGQRGREDRHVHDGCRPVGVGRPIEVHDSQTLVPARALDQDRLVGRDLIEGVELMRASAIRADNSPIR
jgi:hypothetical protein